MIRKMKTMRRRQSKSETTDRLVEIFKVDFRIWVEFVVPENDDGEAIIRRTRVALSRIKELIRRKGTVVDEFKLLSRVEFKNGKEIIKFCRVKSMSDLNPDSPNLTELEELIRKPASLLYNPDGRLNTVGDK